MLLILYYVMKTLRVQLIGFASSFNMERDRLFYILRKTYNVTVVDIGQSCDVILIGNSDDYNLGSSYKYPTLFYDRISRKDYGLLHISIDLILEKRPYKFEWQQYVILNSFIATLNTKKEVIRHYWSYEPKTNLLYNFSQLNVLVYSGTKTGSMSLYASFKEIDNGTLGIHYDYSLNNLYQISDIIQAPREEPLLIITSYRDPISRIISQYFQRTEAQIDQLSQLNTNIIDDVIAYIRRVIDTELVDAWHPFLENNKRNYGGVNIYDKPFNREEGYQIYETPIVKIIILMFDRIAEWEEIIRRQTQYSEFKLITVNQTNQKSISNLYTQVCNEIAIPMSILDELFEKEKDNINYFYDSDDIIKLKEKWGKIFQPPCYL